MNTPNEKLKSHKLPNGTRCPSCGWELEGATPVEQRELSQFKPGHICVCFRCAVVSQVTPDGLRQMTNEQISKLPDKSIEQLHVVVGEVRRLIAANGKS